MSIILFGTLSCVFGIYFLWPLSSRLIFNCMQLNRSSSSALFSYFGPELWFKFLFTLKFELYLLHNMVYRDYILVSPISDWYTSRILCVLSIAFCIGFACLVIIWQQPRVYNVYSNYGVWKSSYDVFWKLIFGRRRLLSPKPTYPWRQFAVTQSREAQKLF